MGTDAEVNISAVQSDQFRDTQSRLNSERKPGIVASTCPGCPVWRSQQGFDFSLVEEGNQSSLESLLGNGKHSLDSGGVFGVTKRRVAEQGSNRSKPGVASARTVSPLAFEMVEKGADQRGVKVINVQLRRFNAQSIRREAQQQS